MSDQTIRPSSYRWIPWMFVAGLGLVIAVNGVLIYFATREPVDVVSKTAYQDGLQYNAVIQERAREAALGWQVAAGFFGAANGKPGEVAVEVNDRTGKPLDDLAVRVRFSRPIEAMAPVEATLDRERPGRYRALVTLPRAGQWDLHVELAGSAGQFKSVRRIVVQ